MNRTILKDHRIPIIRKIVLGIIAKVDLQYSKIMITGDNTLVIIVQETAMYLVKIENIQPGFMIGFEFSDIMDLAEDEYIPNIFTLNYVSRIYNFYHSFMIPDNILAYEENLRDNPDFEMLLGLKSADGAKMFQIHGNNIGESYFVPIFSGFPSMNKNDKIDIVIYDMKDGNFLVSMNIFKKKINNHIRLCFKTINLSR